jgi:hypothetical protein
VSGGCSGVGDLGVAVVSPAAGSFEFAGGAASEAGAGVFPFFDGGLGVGFTVPEGGVGFRAPADAFAGGLAVELVLAGAAAFEPAAGDGAVGAGALGRGGGAV